MKINVNYYAMFREAAGCSNETVSVESANAVDLFETLKFKYDFAMCRSHVRLAINDEFVDWETPLNEGDSVVFIPPVAGG
jgi:molybdopterin converting factor subunit 1